MCEEPTTEDVGQENDKIMCTKCGQFREWNDADQKCIPINCTVFSTDKLTCNTCNDQFSIIGNSGLCMPDDNFKNCKKENGSFKTTALKREIGNWGVYHMYCNECKKDYGIRMFNPRDAGDIKTDENIEVSTACENDVIDDCKLDDTNGTLISKLLDGTDENKVDVN